MRTWESIIHYICISAQQSVAVRLVGCGFTAQSCHTKAKMVVIASLLGTIGSIRACNWDFRSANELHCCPLLSPRGGRVNCGGQILHPSGRDNHWDFNF